MWFSKSIEEVIQEINVDATKWPNLNSPQWSSQNRGLKCENQLQPKVG